MENKEQVGKKQIALNIVSGKSKHKIGFGAGSIDLNNISPVVIDRGVATIDIGAMHAKSKPERRIRFSTNREDVPNGRQVWIVWVAVDRDEMGQYYAGATASEMWIDEEARKGWKILADHVNRMDAALKRKFMLSELSTEDKKLLKDLLVSHNEEWWERSPEELKQALDV
ncbi:YwhD family protein [Paenibacillus sp. VCA1]|uniref:YwhD family protein n=1 Tax=Paenibacillus sp. VCA1 TaxID=3039148 RepID=UPI00287109B5|nr:YwhD family protein [Paenibacillus sp. VCA1]MDR9857693.1 YwhD family protein [Paenibacillus sp. VCA1]